MGNHLQTHSTLYWSTISMAKVEAAHSSGSSQSYHHYGWHWPQGHHTRTWLHSLFWFWNACVKLVVVAQLRALVSAPNSAILMCCHRHAFKGFILGRHSSFLRCRALCSPRVSSMSTSLPETRGFILKVPRIYSYCLSQQIVYFIGVAAPEDKVSRDNVTTHTFTLAWPDVMGMLGTNAAKIFSTNFFGVHIQAFNVQMAARNIHISYVLKKANTIKFWELSISCFPFIGWWLLFSHELQLAFLNFFHFSTNCSRIIDLVKPGGTGILVTDFVSTDTLQELWELEDEDLDQDFLVRSQALYQPFSCHAIPSNYDTKQSIRYWTRISQ